MDFTVIIPSRNRPVLLRKAIESVLMQDHDSFEVLIINDGSDGENEQAYRQIEADFSPAVKLFDLEKTSSGHGQSYGINIGAELAQGKYLTFLDDDDFWLDAGHLSRCQQVINAADSAADSAVDAIYCDQRAIKNGQEVLPSIWLGGLMNSPQPPVDCIDQAAPAYRVDVKQLIRHPGFGHLNTSLISKALYQRIGGMDNNIRYECDRDFYLRCIDAAEGIAYIPVVVSQHNAPDQTRSDNMSTVVSDFQKLMFQLYVLDKARLFAQHAVIRTHGRIHKGFTLKKIVAVLAKNKQYQRAFGYACEALGTGFSLKWAGYTLGLGVRALFTQEQGRAS
tara:strand:+ start:20596 stop:21603 length:1008 start_codon:yes stop_codon:yes gene_type:complete